MIVGGFGAIEVDVTGDPQHPLALWPVDGATIRINTRIGMGGRMRRRYEQVTGQMGPKWKHRAQR